MFTSVCFIPAKRRRWVPGRAFLEDLFRYLGAETAWSVRVYSKPMLPDTDWHDSERLHERNVTCQELLDLLEERLPGEILSANLKCRDWSRLLFEELKDYAEKATTEMCAPCDVDIIAGLNSLAVWDREGAHVSSWFTIDLHSDGLPDNPPEFFDVVTHTKGFQGLKSFLEEATGFGWQMLMDLSW